MSRMAEQAHDQQERENESGIDLCEAYYADQRDLPAHKRDGYAERMQEALEAQYDEIRECFGVPNAPWHEHNRRLIDEIHEVVEKQIKEPKDENKG